jgi:hypothetical protein
MRCLRANGIPDAFRRKMRSLALPYKPNTGDARWTNCNRPGGATADAAQQRDADSAALLELGRSDGSRRLIDQAILKSLQFSLDNSCALAALAQIELHLAQSPSARSRTTFDDLLDRWGRALIGVDTDELDRLKQALTEAANYRDLSATIDVESDAPPFNR